MCDVSCGFAASPFTARTPGRVHDPAGTPRTLPPGSGVPGPEEEPAPSFPNSLPAAPSRKAETGGGTPKRRCGLRAQAAGEARCACRCRCGARGQVRGGARASAGALRAREPNARSTGNPFVEPRGKRSSPAPLPPRRPAASSAAAGGRDIWRPRAVATLIDTRFLYKEQEKNRGNAA